MWTFWHSYSNSVSKELEETCFILTIGAGEFLSSSGSLA